MLQVRTLFMYFGEPAVKHLPAHQRMEDDSRDKRPTLLGNKYGGTLPSAQVNLNVQICIFVLFIKIPYLPEEW